MLETIFKALGDENRLRIINILFRGEFCVCELEVLLNLSQSNLSRHLDKLKKAEIIESKKEGLWVHYKINKEYEEKNSQLMMYLKSNLKDIKICKEDNNKLYFYKKNNLTCTHISNDKEQVVKAINTEV